MDIAIYLRFAEIILFVSQLFFFSEKMIQIMMMEHLLRFTSGARQTCFLIFGFLAQGISASLQHSIIMLFINYLHFLNFIVISIILRLIVQP